MTSHRRGAVRLPKGVHRVVSRGREYYYWQPGRNTTAPGKRIKLPNDAQSPEFWQAIQRLKGVQLEPAIITMNVVFDKYIQWLMVRTDVTAETKRKYERQLDVGRRGMGHMQPGNVRPADIRQFLDQFSDVPGTGNNLLAVLRAVSAWGLERGHFAHSITEAVKRYRSDGGHKPWTREQCLAAERSFADMVRRAYFLARYTGQRGSDVVRLTPGMVDEGGFRITQQKTAREVWCPIEPELAAEMATWERELGPYLKQHWGKVYGRKLLDKQFRDQVKEIPELAGVTFHGLRGTRVVELRQRGATSTQIQDQVGMSLNMIERYCRFADKKANGKASVIALRRNTQ
jgi:integrase